MSKDLQCINEFHLQETFLVPNERERYVRGCLYGVSQAGYTSWPSLGEILPLLLFPTKFHFAFIWEANWPTQARSNLVHPGLPPYKQPLSY